MKIQYLHELEASFFLWLDHEVLSKGNAFRNYSGQLFSQPDPNFKNSAIFASPFRQWVSDTSISGANVPSGVFVDGSYVSQGTSGVSVDYGMGRAFGSFTTQTISASYAVKDFNLFTTHADEAELIFDTKFDLQNKFGKSTSGLAPNTLVFPCIYLKLLSNNNDAFAFGGVDQTNIKFRAIILSDEAWKLHGVMGILSDAARKCFPLIPSEDLPFNVSGSYKEDPYNYTNLCSDHPNDLIFIDSTKATFFSEKTNTFINKRVFGGFVDFSLEDIRTPRI